MKRAIFILGIVAILSSACSRKDDYVYLGQLYNTFNHAAQEKIKGNVKEFRQMHYWAAEENGKAVKGRPYTIEDRKTIPLGNDMVEEYNPEGIILSSTSYDENGKVLQSVKAEAEGKIISRASYYSNEVFLAYASYNYEKEMIVEAIAKRPVADTLLMSIKYEYDANGFITKTQTYNDKGEAQGYTTYNRNEAGQPLVVKTFTKDGTLNSQYDYLYNETGERVTQHQQDFYLGRVIDYTFQYEYDDRGNYKSIIFLKDGKPLIFRSREITYFD